MNDQTLEDQTSDTSKKLSYPRVRNGMFTAFGIAGFLALSGTVLGAINFASPVHYAAWILASWLVANILLELFILLHLGLCAYIASTSSPFSSDEVGAAFGISLVVGLITFIGAWVLLAGRHFGWFSVFALGFLCILAFLDFLAWSYITQQEKPE